MSNRTPLTCGVPAREQYGIAGFPDDHDQSHRPEPLKRRTCHERAGLLADVVSEPSAQWAGQHAATRGSMALVSAVTASRITARAAGLAAMLLTAATYPRADSTELRVPGTGDRSGQENDERRGEPGCGCLPCPVPAGGPAA
jgi:hypothetical protein